MPDDTTRVLVCLVHGEDKVFMVNASIDDSIYDLKSLIKGHTRSLQSVYAQDLLLWKLREPELITPVKQLRTRIDSLGHVNNFAVELDEPSETVLDAFPRHPDSKCLHIIVQVVLPANDDESALKRARLNDTASPMMSIPMKRTGSQPPVILDHWTPRIATVNSVYQRMKEFRLVQVRGTPGSGKTILMQLLHAHILSQDPGAIVEIVKAWPKTQESNLNERMTRIKTYPFRGTVNHYVLFDNGHNSYWDSDFWESFFNDSVQHGTGPYAIVLCSYGSPGPQPVDYDYGTSIRLPPCSRVSLMPRSCPDLWHSPVGLLFSRQEFDETLERFKGPDHDVIRIDEELQETLFNWTMGHAGAIGDLLFKLSRTGRQKLRDGGVLNVEDFLYMETGKLFPAMLEHLPSFSRGLPQVAELQKAGVATVFRELLIEGSITRDGDVDVDFCHRRGWMHSELDSGKTCYTFPSPLHATYISWRLIPSNVQCPYATVQEMAFTILKKFNPSQLSSPSRIGVAFSDRPLEARYQSEFYRGLFAATGGGVRICPELFTERGARQGGRINFYIPATKWGIELLREGSGLAEHSSRFSLHGKYGVWLTSNLMIDYIILDCRTSIPSKPHSEMENLFHAVFDDKFRHVTILNNELKQVEEFALLEGH